MKFGLYARQLRQVQEILEQHPNVKETLIFGSRAMGNYKEASDIDIAIKGNVADAEAQKLKAELEDTSLPFFFDVVAYPTINNPKMIEHIDNCAVLVNLPGWRDYDLREVAEIQTGPFGSQLHQSDYKAAGTPIITVEHLGENRIIHSDLPLVGNEDKKRLQRYTLRTGDIVFSRVGSVDRCAYVSDKEDGWLFSGRLLRVRPNSELVDSRFLSNYFCQEKFRESIRMIAVGATMPSINTEILSDVHLTLPPLSVQHAIANVLSSLDDKIELLNRQNKTLEGMAAALWRKMFVEEADSKWSACVLGDFASNIRTGVSVNEFGRYQHYVGLEHIERKDIALYSWGNATDVGSNKFVFEENDILFGKLRSYFHKVCLAPISGICSTDILVIRPKKPEYLSFCLFWFFSDDVVNFSDASSGGTRMPRTNWDTLAAYEISTPPDGLIAQFHGEVSPLLGCIKRNIFSIRTLVGMRDALLPKLVSGQVAVKS